MYLNFELLRKSGLTPTDYLMLVACKQQKSEKLGDHLSEMCFDTEEPLLKLEDKGLVHFIKGTSKDCFFDKARTTSKGNEMLDDLSEAMVSPEDQKLFEWLSRIYTKKGKEIGNQKKGLRYLAQFRSESGIERNALAFLCQEFIKDETCMEYSIRLDYALFKAPNVFVTRFSLEDSKLYQYYLKRKDYFDEQFKNLP
jgi:hypothetical protein